jgi:hypothetical protein
MRPASSGFSVPWIPIAVVAAVAVIGGLMFYLIWQSNQSSSSSNYDKEAAIEADPAPDLPGEYVNLPSIYEGYYGNTEGTNTAEHVSEPVDYSEQGQPPAGGPHWGNGTCPENPADAPPFCGPVGWGIYRAEWPAESVVHSLEHGGLVIWYNTTDQAVIDDLEDLAKDELNNDVLLVMVPYSKMDAETVAVTAWARRFIQPASEYNRDDFANFIDTMKCRFNPESMPGKGC